MTSKNEEDGSINSQVRLIGFHAVFEALRSASATQGDLYLATRNSKARDLAALAGKQGVTVHYVERRELVEVGGEDARHAVLVTRHAGVGAPRHIQEYLARGPSSDAVVLILDHIEDPHNLGAILRSADQFGAELVVTPSRRSAPSTQTVASASAGASAYVPVLRQSNIPQVLDQLKDNGFWVYGADTAGVPAPAADLSGRVALALGSEGRGLSRLVAERCDQLVAIPTQGHVDSLNVSVSAGILLFEIRRQQGFAGI